MELIKPLLLNVLSEFVNLFKVCEIAPLEMTPWKFQKGEFKPHSDNIIIIICFHMKLYYHRFLIQQWYATVPGYVLHLDSCHFIFVSHQLIYLYDSLNWIQGICTLNHNHVFTFESGQVFNINVKISYQNIYILHYISCAPIHPELKQCQPVLSYVHMCYPKTCTLTASSTLAQMCIL